MLVVYYEPAASGNAAVSLVGVDQTARRQTELGQVLTDAAREGFVRRHLDVLAELARTAGVGLPQLMRQTAAWIEAGPAWQDAMRDPESASAAGMPWSGHAQVVIHAAGPWEQVLQSRLRSGIGQLLERMGLASRAAVVVVPDVVANPADAQAPTLQSPPMRRVAIVGVGLGPGQFASDGLAFGPASGREARGNLGLAAVEKLADRLGIAPGDVALQAPADGDASRSAVAIARQVHVFDGCEPMEISVVYPGPGPDSHPALMSWLRAEGFKPSEIIVVCDDAQQPELSHSILPGGPVEHPRTGRIVRDYGIVLPVMRIGSNGADEGGSATAYDASGIATDRAAQALEERLRGIAQRRGESALIDPVLAQPNALQLGGRQTLRYWDAVTVGDVAGLNRIGRAVSTPVLSAPLFLPSRYVDHNIRNTGIRLDKLASSLLVEYKRGNPAVRQLLELTVGRRDPLLIDWYRHCQYQGESSAVSFGPDTCWDFLVDPQTGVAYLLEGDRNGGGRPVYYPMSRLHLNKIAPGLGDRVQDAQFARIHSSIRDEYLLFCEKTGQAPKARPTIALLHAEHKLRSSEAANGGWTSEIAMETYFSGFDTHLISEKQLRAEGGRLLATTGDGAEIEVDMLYHLVSPAMMNREAYYPVIQAIMADQVRVLCVGDQAKDLIYLNKPLYAAMSDVDMPIGLDAHGHPITLRSLLDTSIEDLLPAAMGQDMIRLAGRLDANKQLSSALAEGVFGAFGPNVQEARRTLVAHRRIFKLVQQLQPVLPNQILITPQNVDTMQARVVGRTYIKGDGLTDYGGRTTAAPAERQRARGILEQVRQGDISAVAQYPLPSLQHPAAPMRVEIRWWGLTDREVHPDADVERHSREALLVRASAVEHPKVHLRSGGETVLLRF